MLSARKLKLHLCREVLHLIARTEIGADLPELAVGERGA
jgi:hypothetical protein